MARSYKRDGSGRFAGGGGGGGGGKGGGGGSKGKGSAKPKAAAKPAAPKAAPRTSSTKGQYKAAMSNARNMLRADVKTSRANIEKGSASYQGPLRSALAANYRQRRSVIREAATALGVARGGKKRK
jgi:hypothetical protein